MSPAVASKDDDKETTTSTTKYCITLQDVRDAARRIEGIAHVTPVMTSESINERCGGGGNGRRNLFFKVEAMQKTGSFKFRGALNAVRCLLEERQLQQQQQQQLEEEEESESEQPPPVFQIVAHSSGNHAQAVALATKLAVQAVERADADVDATKNGGSCDSNSDSSNKKRKRSARKKQPVVQATIVMPENTTLVKKNAVSAFGGNIVLTANTNQAREEEADRIVVANAPNAALVHPSEDPNVIAGQGTVCLELLQQLEEMNEKEGGGELIKPDVVIIPVGGGGLASGNTIALRALLGNSVKIVLAEPAMLDDARRSFESKMLLKHHPDNDLDSVADGLRTTLGPNTWPVIRDLVDDVLCVDEKEILLATKLIWERLKVCIEPSSGVGVAVAMSESFQTKYPAEKFPNVAVVLCGGNVDIVKISAKMHDLGL